MAATSKSVISLAPAGTAPGTAGFDVEAFLAEERDKDLLRFSTAGSVDDGKSTLIGRLLYDTQNVYDDQVLSIVGKGSAGESTLDLALLTDGLRAEREQGITIDVAYRYFSTPRRKFIIADTPGHEQYTRNMATGASTADVAIVLIDARKGVVVQSRRHAYIAALLGVPHVVVAINKMDLVDYSAEIYSATCEQFAGFFAQLEEHESTTLHFVPVSALAGENVVGRGEKMPWYQGPTLLALLENIPAVKRAVHSPLRFAVQRVLRPDQNFRGFAGQIAAGTVRPGDAVMILPSRQRSFVRSIVTLDGAMSQASAPLSICLTLEDEVDVSRGDMFVAPEAPPAAARSFTASLVWMDAQPLELGRRYLLKHTSRTVQAQVREVRYSVDVANLHRSEAETLRMNGIGLVRLETLQPLMLDRYTENRQTGSFVLIDAETNATAAAGMVRQIFADLPAQTTLGPVTSEERARRWGHQGAHLVLTGSAEFADAVERALLERGAVALRCGPDDTAMQQALTAGGAIALTLVPGRAGTTQARIGQNVTVLSTEANDDPGAWIEAVFALLRESRVLHAAPGATLGGGR